MKILSQLTCVGDQRAKGAQFQSTCKLCRESHKTQVWLCFLVLSFLSVSTCATCLDEIEDLQHDMENVKPMTKNSDAMLYAPIIDNRANCTCRYLDCYILELLMVMKEEGVSKEYGSIRAFHENMSRELKHDDGCPTCEEHPLENITIFMDRLTNLLQELNAIHNQQKRKADT
uniref:Interleukin n=1 Tax=Salarias fasciatus TaxID=181472 RepID=A0A672I6V9_SALFA